jgi:hypothetical protein
MAKTTPSRSNKGHKHPQDNAEARKILMVALVAALGLVLLVYLLFKAS